MPARKAAAGLLSPAGCPRPGQRRGGGGGHGGGGDGSGRQIRYPGDRIRHRGVDPRGVAIGGSSRWPHARRRWFPHEGDAESAVVLTRCHGRRRDRAKVVASLVQARQGRACSSRAGGCGRRRTGSAIASREKWPRVQQRGGAVSSEVGSLVAAVAAVCGRRRPRDRPNGGGRRCSSGRGWCSRWYGSGGSMKRGSSVTRLLAGVVAACMR